MTDEQRAYWQAYVDALKPLLRVSDWTVTVQAEPADDDSFAEVGTFYGRKAANIRMCADWPAKTPDEQRHSLVHELVHLHLEGVDNVFERLMQARSEGWLNVAHQYHLEATEYAVDGMADAIAPFLPLPPQDAEKVA